MKGKIAQLLCMTASLLMLATSVAKEPTLDDVKKEVLRRTTDNAPPFDRLRKAEVEDILKSLTSLDPNLWGREWCKTGLA